jgi:hypothetical protein
MKKERVLSLIFILGILIISANVIAANDTEIDKSYECLKRQLASDCGDTQNTFENAFNLIAMSYDSSVQSDCKSLLNNKKKTDCWGETTSSAACSIKSTGVSIIALDHIGSDTDASIDWLLSKKKLSTDLTWFLEIDSNNQTECTINGQKITINDNKKLSGSDPSGLKKAYGSYWFEIVDIRKNYTISCNTSFITTLLFKKPSSSIYFVSSLTHSASGGDSTTESVNGYCFGMTDKCDYEGTLWATLALSKTSEDITPYIPYLTAMSEDTANKKYIPLAFLYILDNSVDDYFQGLLNLQKQNKYWKEGDDMLYDTAIALMSLQGIDIDYASNTRDYLLSLRETSGDMSGCWRSHTALLLYSGWPKTPSTSPGPSSRNCIEFNNYCVSRGECLSNNTLNNFDCTSITDVCCAVQPVQLSCEQKQGLICEDNQECSQTPIPALDTSSCCMASCQEIAPPTNECQDNGGFCRTECAKSQEEKTIFQSSCAYNEKCCFDLEVKPFNWWLIILLIILIILVFLAIIFRNQLKIWWFKTKSKLSSKKGPAPTKRPMPPQQYPGRPSMMPRQIIPRGAPVPPRRPEIPKRQEKDKEFDDTMKKLRDMSK